MPFKTLAALLPLMQSQLRQRAGVRLVEAALMLVAAGLALAMFVFLSLALFFWLEPRLGAAGAALAVAGVLFVLLLLALIAVLLTDRRGKARRERDRQRHLSALQASSSDPVTTLAVVLISLLTAPKY